MPSIDELIDFTRPAGEVIKDLKQKAQPVPQWDKLAQLYYPKQHQIVKDQTILKDKCRKDGTVEKSARLTIGLERLVSRRFSEFTFAIPVRRQYKGVDDEKTQQIQRALETIYEQAHIDAENLKRGLAYYAACEVFTMWYTVVKPNSLYGFPSQFKLKCKTYSPMNGTRLYPLINELDDMLAMSFEYHRRIGDKNVTYFETYTEDKHYIWRRGLQEGDWTQILYTTDKDGEQVNGEDITIGKIPGVYLWRPEAVYEDLDVIREEMEYTLSRNSNVLAYNSSPILAVSGELYGGEKKDSPYRLFRMENGGSVSYVSWQQSVDALKFHVEEMLDLYFKQAQMPDISFDKMTSLGNIGYDARQTLLTDAHLRIGDEAGAWQEFLGREFNILKAFLGQMNQQWKQEDLDKVQCKHVITPFIQNDEASEIDKRLKANGNKAIESQLESIQRYGKSADPQATLEAIEREDQQQAQNNAMQFSMQQSMFSDDL